MGKILDEHTISITIPVYNSEPYLEKCLDSIMGQTYKKLEIICVDDDSTDNSLVILKKYAAIDDRIKVIHKKNEGVSIARNTGLENANGDYVLFVDNDDWIESTTCEIALKNLVEQNTDLVIWTYIRERKGESKEKEIFDTDLVFTEEEVQKKLHRRMIGVIDEELAYPENADALCTVWGKLYKRSIISQYNIKFYDIREIGTYEDGLFNLVYLQYVKKAVFLNKYLYHYRRTNDISITESYDENLVQKWDKLFELMNQYIVHNELPVEYIEALNNRISLSLIPLGINEMTKKCSVVDKIKGIKQIVCKKEYIRAVKSLKIQYMPIHWKIFFRAGQRKNLFVIFMLLFLIQKIRGR